MFGIKKIRAEDQRSILVVLYKNRKQTYPDKFDSTSSTSTSTLDSTGVSTCYFRSDIAKSVTIFFSFSYYRELFVQDLNLSNTTFNA